MIFQIVSLFFLIASSPLWALKTAYVSFQHPEGWKCELSKGVWICQSSVPKIRKESVILSIAAQATKWDQVDNYVGYLKKRRQIEALDGSPLVSEIIFTRKRKINDVYWVDSLQKNSEIPGFWARYLATVHETPKAKLAILITYIVSERYYPKLAQDLERMIGSLVPNNEFNINVSSKQVDGAFPGSERLGSVQKSLILERLNPNLGRDVAEEEPPPEPKKPLSPLIWLIPILAIAYLYLKKRKKKSQSQEVVARSDNE